MLPSESSAFPLPPVQPSIPSVRSVLQTYGKLMIAGAVLTLCCLSAMVSSVLNVSAVSDLNLSLGLAERQEVLTQRITKSLLALTADNVNRLPTETDFRELQMSVSLFDETLAGFAAGGPVTDLDGTVYQIRALRPAKQQEQIVAMKSLWDELMEQVKPVLLANQVGSRVDAARIGKAANTARLVNLKLRWHSDQLIALLKDQAQARMQSGNRVQLILLFAAMLAAWVLVLLAMEGKQRTEDR